MKHVSKAIVGVALIAAVSGCTSSSNDNDNGGGFSGSLCETVKIAGGDSCKTAPRSIAIVAVNNGYCTGTFITTRHVLTAGHCFQGGSTRVQVGAAGFQSPASDVAVHPNYDGALDSPFDVAVVTLTNAAPVTPVPLLLSRDVESGDEVVVYGYGLDESENAVVERVRKGGTAVKVTSLNVTNVSTGTIETISDGTGDTCQGDSGGALLVADRTGKAGIVGVVRSGPNVCVKKSGLPSDNTNVQNPAVVDFILQKAAATQTN